MIPLPSPSSQRHKMVHFGRFTKHTAVADKSSTVFTHNGRIPRPPPMQQQNTKSTSHTAQGLSPENTKPPRQKKQSTRNLVAPEAHSLLVAHDQDKIISSKLRQTQKDQDQLSESSHESTQTAIFCEDNIPPPLINTDLETQLQILEEQRTQGSIDQLNKEVKQYFQKRKMTHNLQSDEGSSKSLEYIDLDHCTGVVTDPMSASGHHQRHNHLTPRNAETLNSDDTSTSSECHPNVDTGPLSHMPQEVPASSFLQEDIQNLFLPSTNSSQLYPPPASFPPSHWPPPTPSHIQQHRIHSASTNRVRMGHQPPEPPPRVRQHRPVSSSATVSGSRDGAPESVSSVRHRRTPSESPVRAVYIPGSELPDNISHHMDPSESPVRSSHHMVSSELPVRHSRQMDPSEFLEVMRRQYRTPSESPVRSVHHVSLSESTVKNKIRSSELPQRTAGHLGTIKSSSTKETSDSTPSKSLSRSRQRLAESPIKDVQHHRHSESPVRSREYHRAPPESPLDGLQYHPPSTPQTRSHQQNQLPNTTRRMHPVHTLPESPPGHQHHHPQSQVQSQIIHHASATSASHSSLLSHNHPVELNTGTQSASFSPGQLNVLHHPLTPSNSGRRNLPPTPPRSKKPRPLPSFCPSQPTLMQSSTLQSNQVHCQLSPRRNFYIICIGRKSQNLR